VSITLLLLFIVLCALGIPIATALGVASTFVILFMADMPFSLVAQSMFSSMNSFIMAAVPLFILVGYLMEKGGVAEKIFDFARAVFGWLPGGLGHVSVVSAMIFAGISGSSVADIASVGRIQIHAMTINGYSKDYAVALTLNTSALATIIPPSILMIIAGSVANESIGLLLIAGLCPGVMIGLAFMVYNHIYAVRHKMGIREPFDWSRFKTTTLDAFPALLTPVLLLWGILGGYFTPTEAAGAAAIYTFVLAKFVYRRLQWAEVPGILFHVARSTGTILFIAITGKLAAWVFTFDALPVRVAEWLGSLAVGPTGVMLMIFVFLVLVGMFMDAVAAIFILVPVLLPAVVKVGVDPVHFLVVMVITLAFGLLTPPVGVCLFAVAQVANMSIERVVKASMPLFFVLAGSTLAMTVFPQLIFIPLRILGFR
jgi:tripartite ATP-independent transporter DctM subunit